MMRKIILVTFLSFCVFVVNAQQQLSYAYDAAGNRVSRTITLSTRSADVNTAKNDSVFFEETLAEKQLRIYPNPVETQLTISVSGYEASANGEFSLFNITGALVLRGRLTGETTQVDMGKYPRGIYLLNIVLNGNPSTWKVVKQ